MVGPPAAPAVTKTKKKGNNKMRNPINKQEMFFRRIYKQLNQFVPEMLGNEKPDFWFKHEDENIYSNAFALRRDDNLLEIGTTYFVNGDLYYDPVFIVLFDNELQFARVAELTMDSPERCLFGTEVCHDFDYKNINAIETESERIDNIILYYWLNTFAAARKANPDYFKKIPRN